MSVLLFGGGGGCGGGSSGGGGKMAAHGGSASAASALKGLIQQFTAITGERCGYRKVESGIPELAVGLPPASPAPVRASLGLPPRLASSLLRKRRRRRGLGFGRESAPVASPIPLFGLLAVWSETLTPPASL